MGWVAPRVCGPGDGESEDERVPGRGVPPSGGKWSWDQSAVLHTRGRGRPRDLPSEPGSQVPGDVEVRPGRWGRTWTKEWTFYPAPRVKNSDNTPTLLCPHSVSRVTSPSHPTTTMGVPRRTRCRFPTWGSRASRSVVRVSPTLGCSFDSVSRPSTESLPSPSDRLDSPRCRHRNTRVPVYPHLP